MQLNAFIAEVESKGIAFTLNEPMHQHTTFRIGGNADVFIKVVKTDELCAVLCAAQKYCVPIFILGRGSNLLVSDDGIEGAVVSLGGMNDILVLGNEVVCGAGASLSAVCVAAKDNSLTGLEFAFGIPGSIGGALFMNAGAYGGEMSQVIKSAECVDADGNIITLTAEQMSLGYRTSIFKQGGLYITEVTLELKKGDCQAISAQMEELTARRKEKQPLEFPSAGSTFKRPEGYFAGALIEKNGLKGQSVGAAQVSEKHAGFVINKGGASCKDVCALIEIIQQRVLEADGVLLETEVLKTGRNI